MSVTRGSRALALWAVAALIAAACSSSGGSADPTTAGSAAASAEASTGGGPAKGTVNIAVNPWVGYEANAGVVGYLLKSQLGFDVQYKELTEQVSWEGFEIRRRRRDPRELGPCGPGKDVHHRQGRRRGCREHRRRRRSSAGTSRRG